MKSHFSVNGKPDCGRGKIVTDNVRQVTCLVCQERDEYTNAFIAFKAKQEAAFNAQTPRTVSPAFTQLNDDGVMECYNCHGVLFRERPRSLFSFHFVCSNCGKSMHPMTETGMCT